MPSLDDLTDLRPASRDMPFGNDEIDSISANDALISDVVKKRHALDGEIFTREVTRIRGNYKWNAGTGKYDIQGQTHWGLLPGTITPTSTGDLTITFATSLPTAAYDQVVSGGFDSDGRPGQIAASYAAADKTAAKTRVKMTKNSATTVENLDGFTLAISWDPV